MSELITRPPYQWVRYTKAELQHHFETGEQSPSAINIKTTHFSGPWNLQSALEIAAIWLREFNPSLLSMGYSSQTGQFWTTGLQDNEKTRWERRLAAYASVGADEFGPLFAEPGSREIDPKPLLGLLSRWLNQSPPLPDALQQEIFEALTAAGYRR